MGDPVSIHVPRTCRLVGSSLCVSGAKSGNHTAILAVCNSSEPSQFLQYDRKSRSVFVTSSHDKRESLQAIGTVDGALAVFVLAAVGTAAPAARWTIQDTPAHTVQLVVESSGKCLSVCHLVGA